MQGISRLALTGPATATWQYANAKGELDLLPYEQKLVDDITAFNSTQDAATCADAMKDYQKTFTENVNAVGLTAYPGALIINKHFANIPLGAPLFMYNWTEANIIRERVFMPADKQIGAEPHPGKLAAKLGESTIIAE